MPPRASLALLRPLLAALLLALHAGAQAPHRTAPRAAAPAVPAAAPAAVRRLGCPGLEGGVCGARCQALMCDALLRFYSAAGGPGWRLQGGWAAAARAGCFPWLASARPGAAPGYCGGALQGLTCCPGYHAPSAGCPFPFAPANLTLTNNNLTGDAASDHLWGALGHLIACGVRRVVLQANRLAGKLPEKLPAAAEGWLWELDISENRIEGTLVSGARGSRRVSAFVDVGT